MAWPTPKFDYAAHVEIKPLADPDGKLAKGRVVDLHIFGQFNGVEYDVRWFHEGKEFRARFFEDELEPCR